MNVNLPANGRKIQSQNSFVHSVKKTVAWVGSKASNGPLYREEFHLTAKDGNLQSETSVLNGVPLVLTDHGEIPKLAPVLNNLHSPLNIAPYSIAFIVLPNFDAPACA